MSANDGSSFLRYHGRIGKPQRLMTGLMEPDHDQAVEHQRHRAQFAATALGSRLAGSSRPRSCLQFSKVHSIAQRHA